MVLRRKILVGLVVISCFEFYSFRSHAETSAQDILQRYEKSDARGKETIESIMAANENGFAWANTVLDVERKEKRLYCSPPKMAFTGNQLLDILRRGTTNDPLIGSLPFGAALLAALQKTFPCPDQPN